MWNLRKIKRTHRYREQIDDCQRMGYSKGEMNEGKFTFIKKKFVQLSHCLYEEELLLFSCSVVSDSLWPPWTAKHQASLFFTISQSLLNSCSLTQRCHQTISSSAVPFSSCIQSVPASGSFQMSQLFTAGGQSIGASVSASVLPMNIWFWFPWGLIGLISLQSKGLSKVFSNTTVQKHQFFSVQPSLWFNPHIHTWL